MIIPVAKPLQKSGCYEAFALPVWFFLYFCFVVVSIFYMIRFFKLLLYYTRICILHTYSTYRIVSTTTISMRNLIILSS